MPDARPLAAAAGIGERFHARTRKRAAGSDPDRKHKRAARSFGEPHLVQAAQWSRLSAFAADAAKWACRSSGAGWRG